MTQIHVASATRHPSPYLSSHALLRRYCCPAQASTSAPTSSTWPQLLKSGTAALAAAAVLVASPLSAQAVSGGGGISTPLSGQDLSGQDLTRRSFTKAVLRKTNFSNANLSGGREIQGTEALRGKAWVPWGQQQQQLGRQQHRSRCIQDRREDSCHPCSTPEQRHHSLQVLQCQLCQQLLPAAVCAAAGCSTWFEQLAQAPSTTHPPCFPTPPHAPRPHPPTPPGVSLFGCLAEGSSFRGANLANADLESGNFEEADFTGAVLAGAYVNNAQLQVGRDVVWCGGLGVWVEP